MPVRWFVVNRGISSPAFVDLMSRMAEGSGAEPSVFTATRCASAVVRDKNKAMAKTRRDIGFIFMRQWFNVNERAPDNEKRWDYGPMFTNWQTSFKY